MERRQGSNVEGWLVQTCHQTPTHTHTAEEQEARALTRYIVRSTHPLSQAALSYTFSPLAPLNVNIWQATVGKSLTVTQKNWGRQVLHVLWEKVETDADVCKFIF